MASHYRTVRALALRLLLGEVIEQVDSHGQTLRATRTRLILVQPGDGETDRIVDGDAFDVAVVLAAMASALSVGSSVGSGPGEPGEPGPEDG
jgi:hypothetical protein